MAKQYDAGVKEYRETYWMFAQSAGAAMVIYCGIAV
ncbi:MAG: Unknown protein [uncultured Thiotrichaceae bacterium]|uniref:Uncharacterized protein n=1 Tax=uncultured Thiotrichaceae bacterium TaxID=298394 RepID=A0A6S6TY74_9GAMM|nr:MAG: Unknown protein [uncultured Thiotrichaceae bacterium]